MEKRVNVTLELPEAFVPLVGVSEEALPAEIRRLLAVELVRRGALTYTRAAELVGMSQAELSRTWVSIRYRSFNLPPVS